MEPGAGGRLLAGPCGCYPQASYRPSRMSALSGRMEPGGRRPAVCTGERLGGHRSLVGSAEMSVSSGKMGPATRPITSSRQLSAVLIPAARRCRCCLKERNPRAAGQPAQAPSPLAQLSTALVPTVQKCQCRLREWNRGPEANPAHKRAPRRPLPSGRRRGSVGAAWEWGSGPEASRLHKRALRRPSLTRRQRGKCRCRLRKGDRGRRPTRQHRPVTSSRQLSTLLNPAAEKVSAAWKDGSRARGPTRVPEAVVPPPVVHSHRSGRSEVSVPPGRMETGGRRPTRQPRCVPHLVHSRAMSWQSQSRSGRRAPGWRGAQ